MRAGAILQRQFERDLEGVHAARLRLVFAVVFTLIRSGRLSLTALGRAIATVTSPKHGIKRIDRLLGNPRLYAERIAFYRAIARRVITPGTRPVIIVDWTGVTPTLWALVAAVCFEGRALIVYAEVHPISRYLKPSVNAHFLQQLRCVLPDACAPVIVTDAGFRTPWMMQVTQHGWDFVGRFRQPRTLYKQDDAWLRLHDLWRRTRITPRDLGSFEVGQYLRHVCRLVGVRKPNAQLVPMTPRGRRYVIEQTGSRARRKALEPWILATSLDCSAAKVVAMYRQRMQIEETFRDAKSSRFGLCLNQARTNSPQRAEILLLLASLAHLASVMAGIAAEALQLHLRYQANTVRNRRVLSLAMLGRMVVAREDGATVTSLFIAALQLPLATVHAAII